MKVEDIDLDHGIIYLDGKTGRRVAYIFEEYKEEIKFLLSRHFSGYIFQTRTENLYDRSTISREFRQIVNELGLNENVTDNSQKVVFHTLRHTFCSWLAMSGVALYTIGQLVGHTSTETTKRYAKLDIDTKQKALQPIKDIFVKIH